MTLRIAAALALSAAIALAGCGLPDRPPDDPEASSGTVGLELVADELGLPVQVTHAGDDRVLVVDQIGRVWVLTDGTVREEPFLDITDRTEAVSEQGLFAVAFPDDLSGAGRAYVSYTNLEGTSTLSRFETTPDGSRLDNATEEVLLTVDQPADKHNGGGLAFGPDGYLYYGLGDGSSGGDPDDNGQNTSNLLGTILRLDVSGETGYTVPGDNPFVGNASARDEIWAYGLRNPWRFSFDPGTGDLWIADPGGLGWEEIDHQPAGSPGGDNYGWPRWEGTHTNHNKTNVSAPGAVFPVHDYPRAGGNCSVIGGHVYRGDALPDLAGRYVFGDFCSGIVWTLHRSGANWTRTQLLDTDHRITSFGVDAAGELYLTHHLGEVHRFVLE